MITKKNYVSDAQRCLIRVIRFLKKELLVILVVFLTIVTDQLTKYYILSNKVNFYSSLQVTSWLRIVYVENRGISFGILSNGNDTQRWTLSFLSILVIFYLYYWSTKSPSKIIKISLFVMIGGALGNVFDRLIYGKVIDFISLHVFDYYWYVFNIADIAIVLGGLTILTDLTRDSFVKK